MRPPLKISTYPYAWGYEQGVKLAQNDQAEFRRRGYQDHEIPRLFPDHLESIELMRDCAWRTPYPARRGFCEGYASVWD